MVQNWHLACQKKKTILGKFKARPRFLQQEKGNIAVNYEGLCGFFSRMLRPLTPPAFCATGQGRSCHAVSRIQ